MFRNARIKLTAWYLLIIVCISVSFSGVIYRMLTFEMDRFASMQRVRIERQLENRTSLQLPSRRPDEPAFIAIDPDLVHETKQRLLLQLLFLNAGILVISGGLGYILAGKTLRPIANMLDEQQRFISDASHELRTPLTALKSSLEVTARDTHLTVSEAKSVIKENIEEVNNLQMLTDQLLELARMELKGTHAEYSAVDMKKIVTQAIKRVSALAKMKSITIEEHINSCSVRGNAYRLADVCIILLDNAIKYSPKHTTITVTTAIQNNEGVITVQDHGIGIDKKDMPHIFDRFYRADITRSTTRAHGYGLGLSIAKKIVEEHHGKLFVQSEIHLGSTFTMSLPLQEGEMTT